MNDHSFFHFEGALVLPLTRLTPGFLAVVFLAGAFWAGVFFVVAFLAGAFLSAAPFTGAFLLGAAFLILSVIIQINSLLNPNAI